MKSAWAELLAVAAGGAAGAACRHAVGLLARAYLPPTFPYGTLFVNVAGSLLLGVLVGVAGTAARLPPLLFALVGVGFCGAFTTFSTFATDTLSRGHLAVGLLNMLANNVLAVAAAALGIYIGHLIFS